MHTNILFLKKELLSSKGFGSERCYFVFRSSSPEHISCFGISRICYCYCDSCVSFPMSTTFLRSRVSRLQFCLFVFACSFLSSFLHGMSIVRGGVQITSWKVIYQLPISMLNSGFACNGSGFQLRHENYDFALRHENFRWYSQERTKQNGVNGKDRSRLT